MKKYVLSLTYYNIQKAVQIGARTYIFTGYKIISRRTLGGNLFTDWVGSIKNVLFNEINIVFITSWSEFELRGCLRVSLFKFRVSNPIVKWPLNKLTVKSNRKVPDTYAIYGLPMLFKKKRSNSSVYITSNLMSTNIGTR